MQNKVDGSFARLLLLMLELVGERDFAGSSISGGSGGKRWGRKAGVLRDWMSCGRRRAVAPAEIGGGICHFLLLGQELPELGRRGSVLKGGGIVGGR